jgi:putative hemolysin
MTTLLAVVSISIGISFLCSILEAVLLSVSHAYVALLEDRGDPAGPLLTRLRRQIDEPIAAILTLNTIAHTVGAAVSGALALDVFGSKWMAAFSAVLTLLILVLSEILPKTLGARYWQQLAPLTARVLRVMIIGMRPVLAPLSVLNRLIGAAGHGQASVSRAELEILAEVGRREGQIDDAEWQVVANVMRLRDVVVNEVMTPRTAIVAIPTSTTVLEAQTVMLDTGFLRLPVYNDSVDNIVGILLARDLWRSLRLGERTITSIMREPMLVPETKRVEALIPEMRARRIKMAVVLDEFGGTAGIVTFEDLVEEIVGEIQDEHESGPLPYERISPSEVLANGGASLAELANDLDLELPVDLYDTIGGYVFGQLGRLPKVGEAVVFTGGLVRVLAMDKRRVARVSLQFDPSAALNNER